MRRIRDVLHYCLDKKFSNRQIARVTGISHTATAKYVKRFSEAGMSWPLPDDVDDIALEKALFPTALPVKSKSPKEILAAIDFELSLIHI